MNLLNAPFMSTAMSYLPAVSDTETQRKDKDWSSLPVLLLWLVKDKLDIFDNTRFAAVCRDWRSASNDYPKVLQSVGDGLPWITCTFPEENSLNFFSVARELKFKVDIPECAGHRILFSKRGWILMRKYKGRENLPDLLCLVNPFTRVKILLPPGPRNKDWNIFYPACFTTDNDGYPQCVFFLTFENDYSTAVMKTACPGDEEWTDHTFLGVHETRFSFHANYIITIGDNVYSLNMLSQIKAFNMSDQTWKDLPSPTGTSPLSGFIVENEGELLFVEHFHNPGEQSEYELSSFALYRYEKVAASWKRIKESVVKDTAWFYSKKNGCIATKGKGGLEIYLLCEEQISMLYAHPGCFHVRVEVYDISRGDRVILRVPFIVENEGDLLFAEHVYDSAQWVDIG